MIHWACKRCAEGLEAPECLAGEILRCPKCKRRCRVPQRVEHHEAEVALVGAGAIESSGAVVDDAATVVANGHAQDDALRDRVDVDIHSGDDSAGQPVEFATSRIGEDAAAVPETPEVPDSVAAEDIDPLGTEVIETRLPVVDAPADVSLIASDNAAPAENGVELEVDILIERLPESGSAGEATMDDLIADAVERELAERPPVVAADCDATVEEPAPQVVARDDSASEILGEATLTPEQELERALEEVTPLIQRQLGVAIAQYSSREQAKAAMFARAVVDVYPTRLNVRWQEPDRIVLAVRYRRILRRTMIGTKTLPDLTVEVSFTRGPSGWSLERWQRILAV